MKTYGELEMEEAEYRAGCAVLSDEFKLDEYLFKFGDPDSLYALDHLTKYKELQNSRAKTKAGIAACKKKMAIHRERIKFFLSRMEKKEFFKLLDSCFKG